MKLLPFVLVTLLSSPALAGATAWQELAPGVKVRLVSSDALEAGTSRAGLEIDMPEGTNIYWRVPGETGIPTEIAFAGSSGVGSPAVLWPQPEIDRSRGYLDYIYRGHIVLPITLRPASGQAVLRVQLTLGVCSDMCVPASANLALPIRFGTADPGQSIRLQQAEALVPVPWTGPGEPFGAVTAGADGLELADPDPSIDPGSVIADVGDPSILFDTPQKSPDGAAWTLRLLGGAGARGLEGRTVQLTFMTPSGPYAVARKIAPAG